VLERPTKRQILKRLPPGYRFLDYTYTIDGCTLSTFHRDVTSRPTTLHAKSVLFNCDLVHAGSLNPEKKPRKAVQYKIAHRDDVEKLKDLQGIHKTKYGACNKKHSTYFIENYLLHFHT